MKPHIERLVTAGNADPAGPPVHENNVWLVGDDHEVLVVDPAHDAAAVARAVNGRRVEAILLTHGHWDHVRAAVDFAALVDGPVLLHPADRFLWAQSHPGVDRVDGIGPRLRLDAIAVAVGDHHRLRRQGP